jgi:hypothetical protein
VIQVVYRVGQDGNLEYLRALLQDDDDALLTAKQAENMLGISPNLIKQWVFRERITPVVRGMRPLVYRLSDLERCLDERPRTKMRVPVAWPLASA